MKKIWDKIINFCDREFDIIIVCIIAIIGIGYIIVTSEQHSVVNPIEDTEEINKTITIKVKQLDSIKNDTIEKVYNLSDSASLELFLQLVSE